jgi:methyl-accepting chemotaxis protein
MRRSFFLVLGLLEFAVAAVLVAFGCQLPSAQDVEQSFAGVERVTRRTGSQVRLLRDQVHELRDPEVQQTVQRLQTQLHKVTGTLRAQTIDFDTVRTMSDALGDVAKGLETLSASLDPQAVGKLGEGLGTTAAYLEDKVAPTAAMAAEHLEQSTEALRTDAKRLAAVLREAPLDLSAAREIRDGLARFSDGLDKMSGAMKLQKFGTMREGVKGLESALTTGAEQVERLSGYTYPVVSFSGLRPMVNQRPFWPEGEKIAEGMRKAAEGVNVAGKEMDGLATELPKMREALDESRKVADRSREALANALKQQDKVEPLLRDVPEHAARLAEELPKLGGDLARVLRDTEKLKELAQALREAQKRIDATVAHWPELQTTLTRSADLLKATQQQMKQVVEHRPEFEKAMGETIVLTEELADHLPRLTHHLDSQLHDEETSFEELGQSIDDVSAALPGYAQTASRMVAATRLLLWLVASIVGLHGTYLVLGTRLGKNGGV